MIQNYLKGEYETSLENATNQQIYYAVSKMASNFLVKNKAKSNTEKDKKNKRVLHYISIEFLIGKSLKNNLWNLGLENDVKKALVGRVNKNKSSLI